MIRLIVPSMGLMIATATAAAADQYRDGIGSVQTPLGLARIEGDWRYPNTERLMVGDRVAFEPDPDSVQSAVWIEAQVGTLLLVGLSGTGNGCYTEYVWVHTAPEEDLRTSDIFGTCAYDLEIIPDDETVTVVVGSPNPDEGSLEYIYDGRVVREQVLGMQESGFGPDASARNWIGRAPSALFAAAEWRDPLVELIGREAYDEAQESMRLSNGDGMQLSEGWVGGLAFETDGHWVGVAIDDDDRRLLVVLGQEGEAPRMWGEPQGPLPAPIVEAITKVR